MIEAKSTYESTLINSFANSNSNKIYKYISDVSGYHSNPNFMYLDNVISTSTDFTKAQLFNRYFYSVFSTDSHITPNKVSSPTPHSTLSNIEISPHEIQEILTYHTRYHKSNGH